MPGDPDKSSRPTSYPERARSLEDSTPNEVVILFANERDYDLDRCVWIAEQALGLGTEGVIGAEGRIREPVAGASVHLVDGDGECTFYFGAPEQIPIMARMGNGRFFKDPEEASARAPQAARAILDHRSWAHLALEPGPDETTAPPRNLLLQQLTAGFMDDKTLLLHLPEHDLFVDGSEKLRTALKTMSFAEALREVES